MDHRMSQGSHTSLQTQPVWLSHFNQGSHAILPVHLIHAIRLSDIRDCSTSTGSTST